MRCDQEGPQRLAEKAFGPCPRLEQMRNESRDEGSRMMLDTWKEYATGPATVKRGSRDIAPAWLG